MNIFLRAVLKMLELLKKFCNIDAPSGSEEAMREAIIEEIAGLCEYRVDALGSIIAFKRGKSRSSKKVMLDAHMDEVGIMLTGIKDEGFLSFTTVGGIEETALVGSRVKINGLTGVIALTPVHLLTSSQREKKVSSDELYIDIGANSREDAQKYVSIGDTGTFENSFRQMGDIIKSKALDNRIGCALLVDIIKSETEYDMYFTFTVQEEVGLRGAAAAAFSVAPDYAIILEGTTAADIPGVDAPNNVCRVGNGPAVSFMDRATLYDREMYNEAFKTAKEMGIVCQPKSLASGGNNAGSIQKAGSGVRCIAVNVPVRYLHSPSSMASINDIENAGKLAKAIAEKYAAK